MCEREKQREREELNLERERDSLIKIDRQIDRWRELNSMRGEPFDKNRVIQETLFYIWAWLKNLDASFGYSLDQWCVCPGDCIKN